MNRCRRPYHAAAAAVAVAFLLLLLASALSLAEQSDGRELSEEMERAVRRLIGPGSYPPSCRSKCGPCAPCRPVHVPVQPGLSEPLEYYPEAWRCKCGNTLFLP